MIVARGVTILASVCAAGLFVASLKLPVWHLKMEAPQYQEEEALRVRVYPGSMSGDLREITVLNKYIGVRIPGHLPQLEWLPWSLGAAAVLGIGASLLPGRYRRGGLIGVACLLALAVAASAALAQHQMHEIGHKRDPHAALKGVHDFTPPLLGKVKIANFEITARLGSGALLIGAGVMVLLGAAGLSRQKKPAGIGREPRRKMPTHGSNKSVLTRRAGLSAMGGH